jgi:hypothetical protein
MIAVAILGGLFALLDGYSLVVIACGVLCLTVVGARWLVFRDQRLLAAFGFWTLAALTNLSYAAACVAPSIYLLIPLFVGWLVIVAPAVGSLGTAWSILATRVGTASRRSPSTAWLPMIALCLMPLVTLWTLWPLRLGFLVFRPALDRIADQVVLGQGTAFPRWVGPFRLARSAVDPVSGNVGLMIDPNPSGPSGFVRVHPGVPLDFNGPFRSDELSVVLGWGWEYREED